MNFIIIIVFSTVCCNQDSFGCAIHALVENVIAFILSCLLIHYDDLQIKGQYSYGRFLPDDNTYELIANLLKGELAAAVLMLVSNFIFIGLFVWVCIKVFWLKRSPVHPMVYTVPPAPQQVISAPVPSEQFPSVVNTYLMPASRHNCPTCGQVVPNRF